MGKIHLEKGLMLMKARCRSNAQREADENMERRRPSVVEARWALGDLGENPPSPFVNMAATVDAYCQEVERNPSARSETVFLMCNYSINCINWCSAAATTTATTWKHARAIRKHVSAATMCNNKAGEKLWTGLRTRLRMGVDNTSWQLGWLSWLR